jgi:hypothetical protein
VGASIVAVVATSSASASAYVRSRLSNIRLGMFLEVGTCMGALAGAFLSILLPVGTLQILFAVMAFYVCFSMLASEKGNGKSGSPPDPLSSRLRLNSDYMLNGKKHKYSVRAAPLGFLGSVAAGIISGLFGIGGGVIKVPIMNMAMGVPLRAAAATSNFMIGVTAATGAAVFFSRGYVVPELAAPVALGVAAGSLWGSSFSHKADISHLRLLFIAVLFFTAVQMLLRGLGVSIGF